jgi:hypothetical protein
MNDGLPDLQRDHASDCDRAARRNVVSAEVVCFMAPPRGEFDGLTDFPTIAFRLMADVVDGVPGKNPLEEPAVI